jgi:hypothetical protein
MGVGIKIADTDAAHSDKIEMEKTDLCATTGFLENLNDVKITGGIARRSVSALSGYGRIVE